MLNYLWSQDYAGEPYELSAKYLESESEFFGEEQIFPEGYIQIIDTVSTDLNILYNKAVNSINYSGTSVSISTTDGSSYTAKKVIVTVPLAILKEDSITFTPSLPLSNRLAITLLGAGVMDKLILEFD